MFMVAGFEAHWHDSGNKFVPVRPVYFLSRGTRRVWIYTVYLYRKLHKYTIAYLQNSKNWYTNCNILHFGKAFLQKCNIKNLNFLTISRNGYVSAFLQILQNFPPVTDYGSNFVPLFLQGKIVVLYRQARQN